MLLPCLNLSHDHGEKNGIFPCSQPEYLYLTFPRLHAESISVWPHSRTFSGRPRKEKHIFRVCTESTSDLFPCFAESVPPPGLTTVDAVPFSCPREEYLHVAFLLLLYLSHVPVKNTVVLCLLKVPPSDRTAVPAVYLSHVYVKSTPVTCLYCKCLHLTLLLSLLYLSHVSVKNAAIVPCRY